MAPTSASSQGSEDSTLPLSTSGSDASDRSSGTPPVPESSSDTGPTSPDGPMLLPTPTSNQPGGTAAQHLAGKNRMPDGANRTSVTDLRMAVESISSQVDFRVNRSAPLEEDEARMTTDIYGRSSQGSSLPFDPDWSSLKMSPVCSRTEDSPPPLMTAAYAAGLLDGEGCIGIAVNKRKSQPTYTVTIDFGMARKALPVLEMLHQQYGGTLRLFREATKVWDEAWTWRLNKRSEARAFLTDVMPHVLIKHEQVDLALRLIAMVDALPTRKDGHPKWTAAARSDAGTIRARVMEANRKGPTVSPQAGWFARYVGEQWQTDQRDLFSPTGWETFSGPWPRWGSMHDGRVFAHPTPGRVTSESASSSLPTVKSSNNENRQSLDRYGPNLGMALNELLHTPTTGDTAPTYDHRASPGYTRAIPVPNLAAQVDDLLPTPRGRDKGTAGDVTGSEMTGGPNLTETVLSLGDRTKPPSEGGNE